MITIHKATAEHIEGISKVCSDGYRATYIDIYPQEYIDRIIQEFYNYDRILNEVTTSNKKWGGYFVAIENNKVVGAAGGGMIGEEAGELFVIYLDPTRRNEGIGTLLLHTITLQQKEFGAIEQWVSTPKNNQKGIPFYEARGFTFQFEKYGYGNIEGEDYISLRYWREI